jgi:hypothetical protein
MEADQTCDATSESTGAAGFAMARDVHDREDLFRDAVALSPRVQLRRRDAPPFLEVFAGFRGDCLSVYFGDDPVFHFNSAGELRRAFVDNLILKAESGQLVALQRMQSTTSSQLTRLQWDDSRFQGLLDDVDDRLCKLLADLTGGAFDVVGQFPADGDAQLRLRNWLQSRGGLRIAQSPRVG